MKAKYVQMPERAFVPLHKAFKTECCDCRLVHAWTFTERDGVMGFDVVRDNRATAQRRKPNNRITEI